MGRQMANHSKPKPPVEANSTGVVFPDGQDHRRARGRDSSLQKLRCHAAALAIGVNTESKNVREIPVVPREQVAIHGTPPNPATANGELSPNCSFTK